MRSAIEQLVQGRGMVRSVNGTVEGARGHAAFITQSALVDQAASFGLSR
jgi:hypothetical protein